MTMTNLKELTALVGVKSVGTKADLIVRLQALIQQINDTGTAVVVSVGKGPTPWVLANEQVIVFNSRCKRLVIPAHMQAFCTTESGTFDDNSSCWRLVGVDCG